MDIFKGSWTAYCAGAWGRTFRLPIPIPRPLRNHKKSSMRSCLEALRDGNGLRIIFERRQDRYAHSIEVVHGESKQVPLSSIEGDDQTAWPASPPLQQLSFERRPDGSTIALAIGMAGSSHWSLSAETDSTQLACEFDVACRCVREPEQLGSRYQV